MATSQGIDHTIVYLEDVEAKVTQMPARPNGGKTASRSTAGNKRQRSIIDMFGGGSQSCSIAQKYGPSAKRRKVSASESTLSSQIDSTGTLNLKLNAIPFSLSQFQEALSEEERELLLLECVYMGKIWCNFDL